MIEVRKKRRGGSVFFRGDEEEVLEPVTPGWLLGVESYEIYSVKHMDTSSGTRGLALGADGVIYENQGWTARETIATRKAFVGVPTDRATDGGQATLELLERMEVPPTRNP